MGGAQQQERERGRGHWDRFLGRVVDEDELERDRLLLKGSDEIRQPGATVARRDDHGRGRCRTVPRSGAAELGELDVGAHQESSAA